ncbi:MAG: hypothetical protein ABJI99_01825, partial [Lentilitoribacter sp.]
SLDIWTILDRPLSVFRFVSPTVFAYKYSYSVKAFNGQSSQQQQQQQQQHAAALCLADYKEVVL